MFKKEFKVVEIRLDSEVKVTHYLRGTKEELEKDIEAFKEASYGYEMFGSNGMVVWSK